MQSEIYSEQTLTNIGNWKRTTVSIDKQDFDYMKKHNLKASYLIRSAIRDHRVATNDPLAEPSTREMKRRIESLTNTIKNIVENVDKKFGEGAYFKAMTE